MLFHEPDAVELIVLTYLQVLHPVFTFGPLRRDCLYIFDDAVKACTMHTEDTIGNHDAEVLHNRA
jgi:hypothetical protein